MDKQNSVIYKIVANSIKNPNDIAIERIGEENDITYEHLVSDIIAVRTNILEATDYRNSRIGYIIHDVYTSIVVDLALQTTQNTQIPVPHSFSKEQISNLISTTEYMIIDSDADESLCGDINTFHISNLMDVKQTRMSVVDLLDTLTLTLEDDDIIKIIHTSGTTGLPKGVRTKRSSLDLLTSELVKNIKDRHAKRYFSILPYTLLIEQVFAVNVILTKGGTIVLLPRGMEQFGNSNNPASIYVNYFKDVKPSMMLVPPAILEYIQKTFQKSDYMYKDVFDMAESPMICCGGAPVSKKTLEFLVERKLEIYEGYGLSETGSVIAWNTPEVIRIGSVGKPAPYIDVKFDTDGEILINTPTMFDGYETKDNSSLGIEGEWLRTGDIGYLDEDGFLYVTGRKKNLIITSSGRNISPEWVENLYRSIDGVDKFFLFGDMQESLIGLVVSECSENVLLPELQKVAKENLPDFASIRKFVFSDNEGISKYMTVTGRPMRDQIYNKLIGE